jgi:hypothetical protein
MSEIIKPCPFCGGEAAVEHLENGRRSVGCIEASGESCIGFQMFSSYETDRDAIAAWNVRAVDPKAEALIRHDERKRIIAQGCIHTIKAGDFASGARDDILQWQEDQSEFFEHTILEIVAEYAAWRDTQRIVPTQEGAENDA